MTNKHVNNIADTSKDLTSTQPDWDETRAMTIEEQLDQYLSGGIKLKDVMVKDLAKIFNSFLSHQRQEIEDEYEKVFNEVSKVYCEITNWRLSKPGYKAEDVITVYEDCVNELVNEAVAEAREEIQDSLKMVHTAIPSQLSYENGVDWGMGYNQAVDEFNAKLTALREKEEK